MKMMLMDKQSKKKKTNTKMNQSKKLDSMTMLTEMTMIKMVSYIIKKKMNNSKRKMNGMLFRMMVTVKRKKKFLSMNFKSKKDSLNIIIMLQIYLPNSIIKAITIQEEINKVII